MATPKTVNGTLVDASGGLKSGAKVTVQLSAPASITGTSELSVAPLSATTASDGTYSFSLYSNADLTPSTTHYVVTEMTPDGGVHVFNIVVPQTAGPFQISSITS